MQILIKTIDEFRSDHMTIKVTGTSEEIRHVADRILGEAQTPVEGLSSKLYTAEQVGDFQASEAELVAAPLRRRVAELENQLAQVSSDKKKMSDALGLAYKSRDRARDKIAELETDISRRVQNTAELERQLNAAAGEVKELRSQHTAVVQRTYALYREHRSERRRADENRQWAERAEAQARGKLIEIKKTVDHPEVKAELDKPRSPLVDEPHVRRMASALNNIRTIVNP